MQPRLIISARDLNKSYPGITLFHDGHFDIYEGDRIGLVGANGVGKTTLIKLITGEEKPDLGTITVREGLRFGVLTQYDLDSDRTVEDELAQSIFLKNIQNEINSINKKFMDPGFYESADYQDVMNRYSELQETMAKYDADGFRSNVVEVLRHLKFGNVDLNQKVSNLSGGERRKIALAKVLVGMKDMDILVLDEPTNHLDIDAIEWLEDYLMDYNGTMIIISHDRYLLDDMVDRLFEIENQHIWVWNGDYTHAMEQKSIWLESKKRSYKKYMREIQREKDIIQKRRRRNKFDAKIRENIRRLQMKRKKMVDPVIEKKALTIRFKEEVIGSRIILSSNQLCKAYGSKVLFNNVDFEIEAGDKVGIIGPNGAGKSTLFKMITGEESPDFGELRLSRNAVLGYYDQGHLSLHDDLNLIEELQTVDEKLSIEECKAFLGRFKFRGNTVVNPVGRLSGGERARLSILKLVMGRFNMLLLDEPTNHLDLEGRAMIEKAVNSFKGTVLIASHDRYFVDSVADRILAIRDGMVLPFKGNYTEFRLALHEGRISWEQSYK